MMRRSGKTQVKKPKYVSYYNSLGRGVSVVYLPRGELFMTTSTYTNQDNMQRAFVSVVIPRVNPLISPYL